jgi:hypothetical protein
MEPEQIPVFGEFGPTFRERANAIFCELSPGGGNQSSP